MYALLFLVKVSLLWLVLSAFLPSAYLAVVFVWSTLYALVSFPLVDVELLDRRGRTWALAADMALILAFLVLLDLTRWGGTLSWGAVLGVAALVGAVEIAVHALLGRIAQPRAL